MNTRITSTKELWDSLEALKNEIQTNHSGKIDDMLEPTLVECNFEERSAIFRYRFFDWMQNCNNVMHGGMIAALLDTSMGWLAGGYAKSIAPTITVNVSYIDPVPSSYYVLVRAKLTGIKNNAIYASGELYLDRDPGHILATAAGTFYRKKES